MIHQFLDILLHLDRHLNIWAGQLGGWTYALLAVIVFCETGFVVTPFLPGDSLLFAVGALAASQDSPISLVLVIPLLCLAANAGDLVNYAIGRRLGPRVFNRTQAERIVDAKAADGAPGALDYATPRPKPSLIERLLNRKHLLEAQRFYDTHGRKTIIVARFVPIVRTFAPFVAGVGRMNFAKFAAFSVGGGVIWVTSLTLAGYFFGRIPIVQKNFEVVVLAIVAISVLPVVIHAIRARRRGGVAGSPPGDGNVLPSPGNRGF